MSLNDQPAVPESDLAQVAVQASESLGKHMKAFIVGGVAVIVVIAGIIAVTSSGRGASEAGWSRFAEASSASDFANVASDFPGTDVAVWARLREAELQLAEGIQLQFTDREAADSLLKKAGEAFDSVLAKATALPDARERALLGKARLLEADSDGDLSAAVNAYQEFLEGFPESVWAEQIRSRIELLQSGDASDFYAWFSQQTPKPEDRPTPSDGMPAGHPEIPVSLPPIPDELIPADWSEVDAGSAESGSAADDGPAAGAGSSKSAQSTEESAAETDGSSPQVPEGASGTSSAEPDQK